MTPAQFAAALARTRLQKNAAEWARLVRLAGWSKIGVARTFGVSPTAVGRAVARVDREHKKLIGVPDDWLVITVCVPRGSCEEILVRDAEDDALRRFRLLV